MTRRKRKQRKRKRRNLPATVKSTDKVPPEIMDDDTILPSTIRAGRTRTYDLEWYEAEHGGRGVVVYGGRRPVWSGSTQAHPGQRWMDVVRAARENYEITKFEMRKYR